MTIQELAKMVQAMREAQRRYFRAGGQRDIEEAKRREKAVDMAVHGVLSQPTLFDREEAKS